MASDTPTPGIPTAGVPSELRTTGEDDLYASARICMVNSQVRPNKVSDTRIVSAMRHIRRERFLPPALRHLAYVDEDIPLGGGRAMIEPMVLARMLQAAVPRINERALVVGAGAGYGAAVLAACGCQVFALEEDPELVRMARSILPQEAPGVTLLTGPLAQGAAAEAPFDLIVIEGAAPEIPSALGTQLKPHTGRLIGLICGENRTTQAVIGETTAAGLRTYPLFDCATPMLPSLRKAPAFEF
jgi:protein-L-isoaspartate(D-aspartate) O-methyltransferase